MTTNLVWHGPYAFEKVSDGRIGLYLWTIPFMGGFLVFYVGKTDALAGFAGRFGQHVQNHKNGRLHIPNFDLYKKGHYKWQEQHEFYVYCPLDSKTRRDDFSYQKYAHHIEGFLNHTQVFLAPVDVSTELLQFEKATLWKVWNAGGCCRFIANDKGDWGRNDISYMLTHSSADATNKIWGLTDSAPC